MSSLLRFLHMLWSWSYHLTYPFFMRKVYQFNHHTRRKTTKVYSIKIFFFSCVMDNIRHDRWFLLLTNRYKLSIKLFIKRRTRERKADTNQMCLSFKTSITYKLFVLTSCRTTVCVVKQHILNFCRSYYFSMLIFSPGILFWNTFFEISKPGTSKVIDSARILYDITMFIL